jgi:hypothetical protein
VLSLAADASDTHVGGVLQQLNGWSWQPLAFYSKNVLIIQEISTKREISVAIVSAP